MPRTLIVTDSTCDLPAEWVRRFDVRIVPTYIHFGTESLADNGIELTRTDFYTRLATATELPTTAAPPMGQTIEIMGQALQNAEHVIAITAAANLSGLHNIFRLAAESIDPARVTLIDSQMLSMGLGWQVVAAAEMIEAGRSPDEIKTAVVAMQPRSDVWAALDTLHYLRRSGRVSWASAIVGDILRIKPLVRLYRGEVTSLLRVRTAQRRFEALVNLAHKAAPLERLAVMHTNNLGEAHRLAEALADIWPAGKPPFIDVTPVIGVHVGPQGLGLAVVRESEAG
jgi:DegV family protein with EDD domain